LTIEILKTLDVALPNTNEQERLLKKYYLLDEVSKKNETDILIIENKIEEYLIDELGLSFKRNPIKKGLSFISSKILNRWDVAFLSSYTELQSKFQIEKIKNCISAFLKDNDNKSLRFESSKYPIKDFYFIGMEHIEKNTGELIELNQVKGGEIKSQTLKVPENFILYGKLRPYLNKYWLNDEKYENIICSSEFFVFDTNERIEKEYFISVLGSSIIQKQIENNSSGARMPRINEETFANLEIPIPNRNVQINIINQIRKLKDEIKKLREDAENKRKQAIKEFEQAIFKN